MVTTSPRPTERTDAERADAARADAPAADAAAALPARRERTREVDLLARAVALLWLEVESGRRRPATVAHLLDHGLWQRLRHRWVRGGPPGQLVRLLVHRKSATSCDAVAVVARGERTGAITFRLCRRDDGWCVVDAGLPELDGAR